MREKNVSIHSQNFQFWDELFSFLRIQIMIFEKRTYSVFKKPYQNQTVAQARAPVPNFSNLGQIEFSGWEPIPKMSFLGRIAFVFFVFWVN